MTLKNLDEWIITIVIVSLEEKSMLMISFTYRLFGTRSLRGCANVIEMQLENWGIFRSMATKWKVNGPSYDTTWNNCTKNYVLVILIKFLKIEKIQTFGGIKLYRLLLYVKLCIFFYWRTREEARVKGSRGDGI